MMQQRTGEAIKGPSYEELIDAQLQQPAPDVGYDINPYGPQLISLDTRRVVEESRILTDLVKELPPSLQGVGLIGISSSFGIRMTPENYGVVRIGCPRTQAARVHELLSNLGLSVNLNHNALSNPQDDTTVIEELISGPFNALLIYQELLKVGINAKVSTSLTPNATPLIRIGNTVIAGSKALYKSTAQKSKAPKAPKAPKGQFTIETNGETSIVNGPPEHEASPSSATKFGPELYTNVKTINSIGKQAEQEANKEREVMGNVSYLVINPHLLLPAIPYIVTILNEIAAVSRSDDFIIKKDALDNIVVIALHERASGYLLKKGFEIHQLTSNKAHIRFETGNLGKTTDGELEMKDYLPIEELIGWSEFGEDHSEYIITKETFAQIKGTREATTSQLIVEEIPGTNYLKIKNVIREAALRVGGGPDRLIGQTEIMKKLRTATGALSKTRLTMIKGQAGIGKSRILDEIRREKANCLTLTIDPVCETVPGMALVNIIDQIAAFTQNKIKNPDLIKKFGVTLNPLYNFARTPEADKLNQAQKTPQVLTGLILNAISTIEAIFGASTIILDDLHHLDTHSDEHVMKMIETIFAENTMCRIIATMRPEDRHKSTNQATLERNLTQQYGANGLATVWLEDPETHKPKLDLHEPQTARDYVFYSLPAEIRTSKTTGKDKKLTNDWHLMLARKIQTPLHFTSLINIILRNPEKYLIISDEEIGLTTSAIEDLDKIRDQHDLLKHERNRIRKLAPKHLATLQLMAMVGTPLSSDKLIKLALDATGETEMNEGNEIINFLLSQNYLTKTEKQDGERGNVVMFELQNEAIAQTTIESIGKKAKRGIVLKHYRNIAADPSIPDEIKFRWLHSTVETSNIKKHAQLWNEYHSKATTLMETDNAHKAYAQGFSHASSVLSNLDPKANNDITKLLNELLNGPLTLGEREDLELKNIGKITNLLKTALHTYIESGANLGQFAKVHDAIKKLETICNNTNDKENPYLLEAYRTGFRMASIEESHIRNMKKRVKMNDYYAKIQKNISHYQPEELLAIQMQYEAREADQGEMEEVVSNLEAWLEKFKLDGMAATAVQAASPEAFAKVKLLYRRYQFEYISRKPQTRHKIDDDGQLDPSFFNAEETRILMQDLRQELDAIDQARKQNPTLLDPIETLSFLELLGQIYSYCGEYEKATQALSETWRVGSKFGSNRQSARAAKLKGDVQLMRASTNIVKHPTPDTPGLAEPIANNVLNRKFILQAINTYTEEALPMIDKVDSNDFYQATIRAARIKAISLLVQTYNKEIITASARPDRAKEFTRIRTEMAPFVTLALADFKFLNSPPWVDYFTEPDGTPEGEFSYYINPYIGEILGFIEQMSFSNLTDSTLPKLNNPESLANFPALSHQVILNGILRIEEQCPEDNVGAVNRKIDGFMRLITTGKAQISQLETAYDLQIEQAATPIIAERNKQELAAIKSRLPNFEELETALTTSIANRAITLSEQQNRDAVSQPHPPLFN